MKHKSTRTLRVIKRTLFACVVLLLAANLFQYFAEPTPPPQLENPKITELTDEARLGDQISYHFTATKNISLDATSRRTLVCEVGSGNYKTISLKSPTRSSPEGPIDTTIFIQLMPADGDQVPPEVYGNYCYLRNAATYPKIHKQFTLFGLGDYRDEDGVDDGLTTYVYDSYNCRDRAGECDRSQMLKILAPLDEASSVDTTGSTAADSTVGVMPNTRTEIAQRDTETTGGGDDPDDDETTTNTPQPPSVLENLIGTVNDVLGGARGLVNGIIRP